MKNLIFAIVFISPPFLKKIILKCVRGAQFGRKSTIGWFSPIIGKSYNDGHSRDKLDYELFQFMKVYYGVIFQ